MDKISPTLNCKNIIKYRELNSLPIYNMGLGANSLEQPKILSDNVVKYSNKKYYTSATGVESLNKIIKKKYSNQEYLVDKVIVGNGLKELLYIVQSSFKGKIFHITPSWVSYKEQILLLNREVDLVEIETTFENGYKIDLEVLNKKLEEVDNIPKIILFNNPNNPTSLVYNKKEVECIAKILKKHNCTVFADEIYHNLTFGKNFYSISHFIPELTIRGSSVSKDLACGGYRLGWITFPKTLEWFFYECWASASSIYSCPCTVLQYAVADTLKETEKLSIYIDNTINTYKLVSDDICSMLSKSNIRFFTPESSWYIFANFDNYSNQLKKINVNNSFELSNLLINKFGIVTVAGEAFNCKGLNLRFSLVDIEFKGRFFNIDNMKKGFNILINFFDNLS